jgi:hypothetical protein
LRRKHVDIDEYSRLLQIWQLAYELLET